MPRLPEGIYQPQSQNTHSFASFADRTGTLLTSSNGSVKITLIDLTAGSTLVSAASVTYSGTPGSWPYTGTFNLYPAWSATAPHQLQVTMIGYDNTGATTYVQYDQTLNCVGPTSGTYYRLSQNVLALPNVSGFGYVTVAVTNNAGSVVQAATSATFNAGTNAWEQTPGASLWVANDLFLVTFVAYQSNGGTQYLTAQMLLRDAAQ